MTGLLNRPRCTCPTCDRNATYVRPGEYDEALGALWARWGVADVAVALGSTDTLRGRHRRAEGALSRVRGLVRGRG